MSRSQTSVAVFQRYAPKLTSDDSNISEFPSSRRVTLNRHSEKEWASTLVGKFNELTALPDGWDGYVGRPVSFTCASFSANLLERLYDEALPPPSLVPGSDGTLQFEWHINHYDVEVDVLAPFNVIATRHSCLTGMTEELELETDFTQLANWIADLKQDSDGQASVVAA